MFELSIPPPRSSRIRRSWCALGAAALALPLVITPSAALAAVPNSVTAGAVDAIRNGNYLPDYQNEFIDAVNSDNIWAHDLMLSHEIGPRPPGSLEEAEAADYVQSHLDGLGFETTRESFQISNAQTYANVTPSRYTDEFASWQFKPASNGVFTGVGAPVSGDLYDLGATTDLTGLNLAGKIVLANWVADAPTRTALLESLKAANVAAVVFAGSNTNESLQSPGTLADTVSDMVVVGTALNQSTRMRALLSEGALSLGIETIKGSTQSANVVGVRPAANGDTEAPIVYIGAHIDSVVGSPGASDNGSGASIMLELARLFSEYSLDTEIRVGAWGAEETGIVGSRHHVNNIMTPEERERTIGAWNMDMAGTGYPGTESQPFGFWALTVDGAAIADNPVLSYADEVSQLTGRGGLQTGKVGRSDHQYFHDAGIPAVVFSWMYWAGGTNIILEPAYHRTTDTLEYVSQERMGIAAEVLGGSAFRASLNEIEVEVTDAEGDPLVSVPVAMSCDGEEGWRAAGTTDVNGTLSTLAPHATCDFTAIIGELRGVTAGVDIAGDQNVGIKLTADAAPTVDVSSTSSPSENGWYTTAPVTVTLTGGDDFDANTVIEYSLDGVNWVTYTAPITLAEDGIVALLVRVTDDFGNVTQQAVEFAIDTVVPELSVAQAPGQRGQVSVTANDATSGIARVEYRVGADGAWQPFGGNAKARAAAQASQLELPDSAVTVAFRAVDVAGNVSGTQTVSFAAITGSTGATGGASMAATGGAEMGVTALAALALLLAGGGLVAHRVRRKVRA